MAERFTDKTEYMASLRDKNRIESIKARVDISDPKVAGELYNRLKSKPAYFETQVGRAFMQSLFVTSTGAKRLSMPAPQIEDDAEGRATVRRNEATDGRTPLRRNEATDGRAPLRRNEATGKSPAQGRRTESGEKAQGRRSEAARTGSTGKARPADKQETQKKSKITIVEGSDNLKIKYNRSLFLDEDSLDALDVLTGAKHEYNDFWDGDGDMDDDYEPAPDPAKRKKLMKAGLIALGGVAAVLLAVFLGKEINYRIQNSNSRRKLQELQSIVTQNTEGRRNNENVTHAHAAVPTQAGEAGNEPGGEAQETVPETPKEPVVLAEYAELFARNPDMVGWMSIPGTVINYPVMQTKEDMEYYLYRDFDRGDDKNGLPFVDARSDVFAPTTNVLIYGHCMNSGAMFASLLNYKDKAYFEAHPVIYFDTVYEHAEYEIIACFQSRVAYVGENVFRYYSFIDTDSETEFDDFVKNIKEMSYYDTGETAKFGDKLITLSTCDKEITNGRMVIVARKVE